jgi:hypothetical protein
VIDDIGRKLLVAHGRVKESAKIDYNKTHLAGHTKECKK